MKRVLRLPRRIRRDAVAVRLLRNWREYLRSQIGGEQVHQLQFRDGRTLKAPPTIDLVYLFTEIWLDRVYAPPGYEVRRGDIVVDIGANVGVFALLAASASGDGVVVAYEPYSSSAGFLRENAALSGLTNIRVLEQAVGGTRGPRTLHSEPENWVLHALEPAGADSGVPSGSRPVMLTVDCVTLDNVLSDNGIMRCDLLKIDCEGSEYEILESCSHATLEKVQRMVVEFHEGAQCEGTGAGLASFLRKHGFTIDVFQPALGGAGYLCGRRATAARIPGARLP